MIDPEQHLDWLRARHSAREFSGRPVDRVILERLLAAAVTAPSASNRQPWRYSVVSAAGMRAAIAEQVRVNTAAIESEIAEGPHADAFENYGDFFWEPLAKAQAIIIPQYRDYPDTLERLIQSAKGDPEQFSLPGVMHPERCATSASVMALLLQAHAEGLGAVWMAGPMVAKPEVEALLDIRRPWQMLGAIALGYPNSLTRAEAKPRKAQDRVVRWFEEEQGS